MLPRHRVCFPYVASWHPRRRAAGQAKTASRRQTPHNHRNIVPLTHPEFRRMPTTRPVIYGFADLVRLLSEHRRLWVTSAAIFGFAALVYSLVRSATWEASQALVVRNEAHSPGQLPGKFSMPDEMKTVQETILELAKSDSVLAYALKQVETTDKNELNSTITDRDIAALRDAVKLTPPNGTEFGKTEMFYLRVKADDRRRAVALATAICDGLDARFQQLRDDKAGSMIAELQKTVKNAETELATVTTRLSDLEKSVGSDLAELRILNETPSGSSDLRQKVVAVENELRDAQNNHRGFVELVSLLQAAQQDHHKVAALPDRLLKSHVVLVRLIEGLSAARLRTSNLLGSKTDEHPLVMAAKAEEDDVLKSLQAELDNAIRIAQTEERLAYDRINILQRQLADAQIRLERLAGLRAEYANRVAAAKSSTAVVEEARRNLAEAQASQTAARTTSQITRVDLPTTGGLPLGPSRSLIVLVGLIGGLAVGFGLVFWSVRPTFATAQPTAAISSHPEPKSPETVQKIFQTTGLTLKQALAKIADKKANWN
jgi:uncharacterized protein involved in exopolysaccharide biosynthesis